MSSKVKRFENKRKAEHIKQNSGQNTPTVFHIITLLFESNAILTKSLQWRKHWLWNIEALWIEMKNLHVRNKKYKENKHTKTFFVTLL